MTQSQTSLQLYAGLKHFRRQLFNVGLFSAVINILMLVPAIYMLQVYDRVLASGNEFTLLMLTCCALGLLLLMGVLEYIRAVVAVQISLKFQQNLKQAVYRAAFHRNLQSNQGSTTQALQDLEQVRGFLSSSAIFAIFDAPWFPIYLAVMFFFSLWFGLLALLGAALLLLLAVANQYWTRRLLKEASLLQLSSQAMASSQLKNAEAIQAMGMLDKLFGAWERLATAAANKQSIASDRLACLSAASKVLRLALQALILGLGAYLVLENSISAGMMIAGSILIARVLAPVDQILVAWKQWSSAQLAYDRLQTLLTLYPEKQQGLSLPAPTGQISLEGVSAVPPQGSLPTLVKVNLQIAAGSVVGIIGPSGSGKSTLARLLTGVWAPKIGSVRLDGADLQGWASEDIGQYFGYLPQDVELFAGSIADNIARFDHKDADKIIQAAQLADVHGLILTLPNGYDTPLGELGLGLSGGQKQRIALARALYGLPKIVVLDEPNSSLDDAGEKALLQAILKLKAKGSTVFLISHRPQILAITDRLLLLNQGIIQKDGPSQEILKGFQTAAQSKGAPKSIPQAATAVSQKTTAAYAINFPSKSTPSEQS
jgi:ATP-binding cassette subfamily C exporter for protease/lipase